MLSRYAVSCQNLRFAPLHRRFSSTETGTLLPRRKRGRPKADGLLTKNENVIREQCLGAIAISKSVVVDSHEDVTVNERPAIRRTRSAGDAVPCKGGRTKQTQGRMLKGLKSATRLLRGGVRHHDLKSFLKYATIAQMDPNSSVYKGTMYEYQVMESLEKYNFKLTRKGQAGDKGIDLLGDFHLPGSSIKQVIIQCKRHKKLSPVVVRAHEGSFGHAPAGWNGPGTLGIVVSNAKGTKGIVDAVKGSPRPMCWMQMTIDGSLKQFIWNNAAANAGLQGLGTTVKYSQGVCSGEGDDGGDGQGVSGNVALTWMGKLWRPKQSQEKDVMRKSK